MRNLKKIIAVVVTLVMLLGVASFAASAANDPTLALYGKSETGLTKGQGFYELVVHLTDAGNTVGGIEGTITYDATKFTYNSVELSDAFVAAGNPDADSVVACDNNGTIKFVGLNNASSVGEWFVLNFEVIATGTADFVLTAKGANVDGYVTVTANGDATNAIDDDALNVAGASIKRNKEAALQDIRFHVDVDHAKLGDRTVVEYGLLLMFTKRLESLGYAELTYDMIENQQYGLAWAKVEGDIDESVTTYAVNLNNMKENALGVKVSARAFAKLSDGTVIYSKNYNSTYGTNAGYESKSVIDVARKAALDCTGADETTVDSINEILAKASIKGDDRAALLSYINQYYPQAAQ